MSTFEETMQRLSEPSQSGFQAQMERYTGQSAVPEEEETVDDTVSPPAPELSWLEENLDLPYGLGGATGGGIVGGMIAGPPGAIAGSVIGGAFGTGYGKKESELLKGTDTIEAYKEGVEAALWSAGIDLATFGVLSKIKPAWYAMRMRQKQSVEDSALEAIDLVYPPGSPESLAATQRILQAKGATLFPSQVFRAGMDGFRERIASVGLISREKMEDNILAVNEVLVDELNLLINKNASGFATDAYNMGSTFMSIMEEGTEVLRKQYGLGLDEITGRLASARFSTIDSRYITNPIDSYLKTLTGQAADKVQPETLKFIRSSMQRLKNLKSGQVRVSELLDIDKAFTQRANTMFGPRGSTPNETINFELAQASEVVREAILNALQRVDPKAAADYKALKESYSQAYNAMWPTINKGFVTQAKGGSYTGLGTIASKASRVDQVKALKASLAQALSTAKKSGDTLVVESFEQANKLIKEGFLSSKLSQVIGTEKANVQKLKSLALSLQNPTQEAIYKEVLGADFPRFKQLMNAIIETAESASGETGTLVLRGFEARGLKGFAQLLTLGSPAGATAAATGGGAAATGIAIGAAALYIPNLFAKVVTNPQYVNKLITMLKAGKTDSAAAEIALNIMVSEIVDEMTDEEKAGAVQQVERMLVNMISAEQPQQQQGQ